MNGERTTAYFSIYPFLRSRIFPDRIYRVCMNTCLATDMKKALSEKILAVFTAGGSIIAVECPVVSRCSMKEANRPVPLYSNRLHEVINRKGLEPLRGSRPTGHE